MVVLWFFYSISKALHSSSWVSCKTCLCPFPFFCSSLFLGSKILSPYFFRPYSHVLAELCWKLPPGILLGRTPLDSMKSSRPVFFPLPPTSWCSHEESSTFWPMSSCLSSSSRTHLSLFSCLHNFMPFRKPNTARFLGCLRWEYTFRDGWEEKCMQCNVYWEVPQKCSLKLGWRKSILTPLLSIWKCNQ